MLLTGFDAHRLKRLYLTRKMKDHELLQALTRVNRPYLDFKYGYVVDFAGIKENFEETNNRYLKELNRCYSDNPDEPSNDIPSIGLAILESKEEIIAKLKDIKEILFAFTCDNPEAFCEELEGIEDKQVLYNLRHELEEAKALSNQIRTYGDDELRQIASKLKVGDLPVLISEVNHRIDRVNQKEQLQHSEEVQGAINLILSQIEYEFSKVMTEEMEIVNNDLKEQYQKVTREFELNFDQQEEQFVDLLKTFREYFRKKGFIPQDVADARERIHYMDEVMKRIKKINADNERLKRAYKNDERFARIHKRIREENEERMTYGKKPVIAKGESEIAEGLNQVREWINKKIFYNYQIMENEEVFKQEILWKLSDELLTMNVEANVADRIFIRNHIANEYIAQFNNLKIS
jgi:type I restriction enzyme R subunit